MNVYFFGCWDSVGHGLYNCHGASFRVAGPFGLEVDGYYAPATGARHHPTTDTRVLWQDETLAALIHTRGWTVLAMWDRSIDDRFGSNAAFFAEGEHTTSDMWMLARQYYPQIVGRLKAAPQ